MLRAFLNMLRYSAAMLAALVLAAVAVIVIGAIARALS